MRGTTVPDADLPAQRAVVDAFLAASREGDFDALLAVLDPDVVLRVDRGALPSRELRGIEAVLRQARTYARLTAGARPAVVNGVAGLIVFEGDAPIAVAAFTIARGRIAEIDVLADPARVQAALG